MTFFGRKHRSERGQGSLESLGIFVLAAILATATVGVIVQTSPTIRENVSYQLCKIIKLGGGGGECEKPGEPRTASDRVPKDPCVDSSTSISAEASASVVVTVKKGYSFLIERMSDGTYKITRVNSDGVGIGVGPGLDVSVTVDGKKYGVTAIASADALLGLKQGETWYADSEGDANDVIKGIISNDIVDEVAPDPGIGPFHAPNPVKWAIKKIIGGPPDSDEQFIEGGIEGNAGATVSGITASAGAEVKAAGYLGAKETPDGYVAYFKTSLSGSAYGAVIGSDATASAGGEVLSEVTIDKDGNPKSIKLTAAVTLNASVEDDLKDDEKYTEYSMEVPLTGDPAHDAPLYAAATGPSVIGLAALSNFADEAKKNGYVTQNSYSQDPNTYGLNFGGELLGKYGGSISGDKTDRNLVESLYFDGTGMVPRPDC
jgi:hypothetical protein